MKVAECVAILLAIIICAYAKQFRSEHIGGESVILIYSVNYLSMHMHASITIVL